MIQVDAHAPGTAAAQASAAEPDVQRWPRPARILFIFGAALACWAVPLTIAYLLIR